MIEKTLDENHPREQAGFRKGYSTTDHLQALNQIIEKSNEYNLPLCIGFIDYEKAFDTVEHFAILEALRKTNVNETYINILQNIYNQATARVHLDKLVSTEFQIHRGVRQGDPLSPILFTAVMEEVFKKAEISEGVNVDGENLSNLRFADDVALLNETIIIIIIIIAFKGAIRDFLQSPHSAANCLQHARSSGPGAIVCKSRATRRALITCNMSCYVPLGTKGQLSY